MNFHPRQQLFKDVWITGMKQGHAEKNNSKSRRFGYTRHSTPLQSARLPCPDGILPACPAGPQPQDCQNWEQTMGQPCRPLHFWMPWVQKRWEHLLSSNILVLQSPLSHQINQERTWQLKPLTTWIRTLRQPASSPLDARQNSVIFTTKHCPLKSFPPVALKGCMWGKPVTEQQKEAQGISSLGDKSSWLPQRLLAAHGDWKKLRTALAFDLVLTKTLAL